MPQDRTWKKNYGGGRKYIENLLIMLLIIGCLLVRFAHFPSSLFGFMVIAEYINFVPAMSRYKYVDIRFTLRLFSVHSPTPSMAFH